MLGLVVGIPEFGGDPEIVTGAETIGHGGGEATADFAFVAVVASTVEMAVAKAHGFLDDGGRGVIGDLPRAKSESGK